MKTRMRESDSAIPSDRIVPIYGDAGEYTWGCGRFRATAVKSMSRWRWRVWDVLAPSLGGSGFNRNGDSSTLESARSVAIEVLAEQCGVSSEIAPSDRL